MFTYWQLVAKKLIGVTFLSILFSALVFFLLFNQNTLHQHSLKPLITTYFQSDQQLSLAEITSSAQSLTNSNYLNFLKIEYISNNKQNNKELFIFTQEKDRFFTFFSVSPSLILLKQQNLKISFLTNPSEFIQTGWIISISLMLLLYLLVLMFAASTYKRQKSFFENINQHIKSRLDQVINNSGSNIPDNTSKTAPHYLPELDIGITEIKAKLNHHILDAGTFKKEAYLEPLTKLENRTRFVQFFENKNQKMDFGVLTLTRCSELQTVNQIHGYSEGDNYICKVSEILKQASTKFQASQIFRLNSSDFATILPNITLKDAENYAEEIMTKFNDYQQSSDLDSIGYTGMVSFDKKHPLGELLALADTGISVAQTQKPNAWYAQTDTNILESSSASYGNQNWRQEIDNVVENQRVSLLLQHIKPSGRNTKAYSEVLSRFLNSNNEMLPTASFIAMAEKLDKIVAVDRMIIDKAITEITDKNLLSQNFGINISSRSINDEHFLIWLERRLLKDAKIAANLIFEISEYGLQQNLKNSKRFIDMVHRSGARVTVERFGVGLTSFKFFRDLKPDFIKMDSTYTHDIDEDKNNQYFLRLMIDLAHRLSIYVLAESVESQSEKNTLDKLFIDGCQGFYIGRPEPI